MSPHVVDATDLQAWLREQGRLSDLVRPIGRDPISADYLEDTLGLPFHLEFAIRRLAAEDSGATLDRLSSIPFFSLCKGLFVPLSSMSPEKCAHLFGFAGPPILDTAAREALFLEFLAKDLGLSWVQKLGCVLGDPFYGKPATLQRDSMIRLLETVELRTHRQLLDRLTHVGDVSVLFAEARPELEVTPKLTASEVLETLRLMAGEGVPRGAKFELLRSILIRCGKLEAYFLARLVLKRGFGFDYQAAVIARVLGDHFGAPPEQVAHAMVLTDAFTVIEVLSTEGTAGLRSIQLQPLVAVRPALAGGTTEQVAKFPVWVERKYDGIRFMLHKSTDARGSVLVGAYTRNRRDWLELVPGLDATIRSLPARNCIVDGELYGTVLDAEGARPATVYEVYGAVQGERQPRKVTLKFAAFDLVYLNGRDLTGQPLGNRRAHLQALLAPVAGWGLPVQLQLAEGSEARHPEDLNRLYGHFRSQGYEGIIAKDLNAPYLLSQRDPTWLKRKPEITLDLVLLGGVFSVTEKRAAGLFGSYIIGARTKEGGFADVGDVAGVDRVRDAEIQAEIMRDGLITGRRIERASVSGVRPGIDLRPSIVVTVRFDGVVKDNLTNEIRLRDPKLVMMRPDKSAQEADSLADLEAAYLRQSFG
jgi:DNA ligase-1